MLQVNHYKKVCQLTDSEVDKITDFIKSMFEVDNIISAKLYRDEYNERIFEIEGFDKPSSKVIGTRCKHDRHFYKEAE